MDDKRYWAIWTLDLLAPVDTLGHTGCVRVQLINQRQELMLHLHADDLRFDAEQMRELAERVAAATLQAIDELGGE